MSHDAPHGSDPHAKLIYMANQISRFFASQGETAVGGTAEHIQKFWDPRMREAISRHLENGGQGLDPIARQAVEQLASK